jgi:hypothetical protein
VRRFLAPLALLVACGLATAADSDTPAQTAMRKAVKDTKISVEWKDTQVKDVAAELADALQSAGVKGAKVKIDTLVNGLTLNMKVSLTAKNKTIAEVLDELGKKHMLGYVILGKDDPKAKYAKHKKADGTLLLTKSDERGDVKN